jgi:hypothetical protein
VAVAASTASTSTVYRRRWSGDRRNRDASTNEASREGLSPRLPGRVREAGGTLSWPRPAVHGGPRRHTRLNVVDDSDVDDSDVDDSDVGEAQAHCARE